MTCKYHNSGFMMDNCRLDKSDIDGDYVKMFCRGNYGQCPKIVAQNTPPQKITCSHFEGGMFSRCGVTGDRVKSETIKMYCGGNPYPCPNLQQSVKKKSHYDNNEVAASASHSSRTRPMREAPMNQTADTSFSIIGWLLWHSPGIIGALFIATGFHSGDHSITLFGGTLVFFRWFWKPTKKAWKYIQAKKAESKVKANE